MKIGLFAINYGTCGDPASAVRVARAAEAAGFESIWTGEHVVLPDPPLASRQGVGQRGLRFRGPPHHRRRRGLVGA